MSHEFYQIMVGTPSISIHSWKQLALWSLEYSCLSTTEIEDGQTIFLKSWEEFCKHVVEKYSALGYFEGDKFIVGEVAKNGEGEALKQDNGKDVISDDKVRESYGLESLPEKSPGSNSKPKPETSVSIS